MQNTSRYRYNIERKLCAIFFTQIIQSMESVSVLKCSVFFHSLSLQLLLYFSFVAVMPRIQGIHSLQIDIIFLLFRSMVLVTQQPKKKKEEETCCGKYRSRFIGQQEIKHRNSSQQKMNNYTFDVKQMFISFFSLVSVIPPLCLYQNAFDTQLFFSSRSLLCCNVYCIFVVVWI